MVIKALRAAPSWQGWHTENQQGKGTFSFQFFFPLKVDQNIWNLQTFSFFTPYAKTVFSDMHKKNLLASLRVTLGF